MTPSDTHGCLLHQGGIVLLIRFKLDKFIIALQINIIGIGTKKLKSITVEEIRKNGYYILYQYQPR